MYPLDCMKNINKIKKNDVVEIITHNFKSYSDIPAHEKGANHNLLDYHGTYAFIGQRFKVKSVTDKYVYNDNPFCGIPIDHVIIYKSHRKIV